MKKIRKTTIGKNNSENEIKSSLANIKFSQFANGNNPQASDIVVGLRGGVNTKFNMIYSTDTLPQGPNNWYATNDGGTTDNLESLPTITNLQNEIDDRFVITNNFSELSGNNIDARGNLGQGTGILTFDQDQDYTITNPSPKEIYVDMPTSNHSAELPAFGETDSLAAGEFILIKSTPTSQNLFFTINGNPGFEITSNQIWVALYVGALSQNGWNFFQQSGSGAIPTMQQVYNAGSIINMQDGQPISINAGANPSSPLYLTTIYSAAFFPAPASSLVIGMSFTLTQDGYITGLSYADAAFSSGTRQVGLWLYLTSTTGTLLATANVAKTDTLHNHFRIASISPITVTLGARYVVAELNPVTDQYLGYQGGNPSFAIVDGWSQSGFVSASLVYPPIDNIAPPGGTQYGNASLEFQASLGITDSDTYNTLLDDPNIWRDIVTTRFNRLFGSGTTAQRNILTPFQNVLWNNTDTGLIDKWDGTEWTSLFSLNDFIAGTNITIDTDDTLGTATISASGTPFSVGAGASFSISSGAITTFTGGTPIPATFSVSNSSATNMTVSSDGTITCGSDGTGKYSIIFSMSARSSASQNTFFFYIAKNDTADTGSLIPITLPTAPGNGGYQVSVIFKENLNPGDTLRLFVANSSGTPTANDLIIQNMLCNCSLDLASSANLQSAWENGGTIEGDLDANPFQIKNSSSETIIKATEEFADLPKNYGNWVPTFSNEVGISGSIILNTARWLRQGAGVLCTVGGSFTASDFSVSFDMTLPIAPDFTDTDQCDYVGGNVSAVPPTVADGNIISYKSNSPDDTITAILNATVGTGDFDFNLSFLYEIQ